MALQLTSSAFNESGSIPSQYTCDGDNISPPLSWQGVPEGTKSLALIVDDPDAPSKTWVHWVVYNIPETVHEALEGQSPKKSLQGTNDFHDMGYGGPCPPSGSHRYFFKLYALGSTLTLAPGATKQQVEQAMEGHILEKTALIGVYERRH